MKNDARSIIKELWENIEKSTALKVSLPIPLVEKMHSYLFKSDFRIEDSDVVITINSKNGKLFSPQMRVFVKDGEELHQVGLIQSLDLKAFADTINVDMCVEFPLEKPEMSDLVKEVLRKNVALLTEKGCVVKSAS